MPDKHGIPSASDLVIFIAKGGYENELALAKATFREGQVLTVAFSEVGRWRSKLSFEGFSGRFNSVMFKLASDLTSAEERPRPSWLMPGKGHISLVARNELTEIEAQLSTLRLAYATGDLSNATDAQANAFQRLLVRKWHLEQIIADEVAA